MAKVAAEATGFEHEFVKVEPEGVEEYKKNTYSLGTFPYLQDSATGEGFGESVAIARFMCSSKPEAGLYGSSAIETAKIDQVIDEFMGKLGMYGSPVLAVVMGYTKGDEQTFKDQNKSWRDYLRALNDRLEGKEFLVGDKLSLADLYLANFLNYFFAIVLDAGFRKAIPHLTKWYEGVRGHEALTKFLGKPRFAGKGIKPKF